jgi:hypothetical protein
VAKQRQGSFPLIILKPRRTHAAHRFMHVNHEIFLQTQFAMINDSLQERKPNAIPALL